MKFIIPAVLVFIAPIYASAETPVQTRWEAIKETAHGGGCRKSSPPGECCHAGSKPLHCHIKP